MIDRTILGRYSRAFMSCVTDKNLVDKVEDQLANIDTALKDNPFLVQVLRNPLLEKSRKKELLTKIFGKSIDPLVKDFFFLLVDKGREEVIPFLYEEFSRLADEERAVVRAEVVSVYSLSSGQLEKLEGKLSAMTGKKVIIKQSVSPDIIGGLVITVGSKIIDASVVGRLKDIKECMLQARLG